MFDVNLFKEKFFSLTYMLKTKPYYGFVFGHNYLDSYKLKQLADILFAVDEGDSINKEFEQLFVKHLESDVFSDTAANIATDGYSDFENSAINQVTQGRALSFGAGRMALYAALKALGIGEGDEVIVTAFTCAVVLTAILRTGARPVYTDIDLDTFGTSPQAVEKAVTAKTRAVIAQHSFGIPCKIDELKSLLTGKGIALIEDCALTFGSRLKGQVVGTFADASFFSTDHTKPLNTMIGGVFYTKDIGLYDEVFKIYEQMQDLPKVQQKKLLKQIKLESKYANALNYGKYQTLLLADSRLTVLQRKIMPVLEQAFAVPGFKLPKYRFINNYTKSSYKNNYMTFLDDDYAINRQNCYPYPAAMPKFLAKLGCFELDRWTVTAKKRINLWQRYLNLACELNLQDFLPKAVFDKDRQVVGLRFVYTHPKAMQIKLALNKRIHTDWFWFTSPVLGAKPNIESLGYKSGTCLNAERATKAIINFPCAVQDDYEDFLLDFFKHNGC